MKQHSKPLIGVLETLSRTVGINLLSAIAERNKIGVPVDWSQISAWPSPEFEAAYKALPPELQGVFNSVFVVIESVGRLANCEQYADMLLAAFGKTTPPGLTFREKVAWSYSEISAQEWETVRTCCIAAQSFIRNWTHQDVPQESVPSAILSEENDKRLLNETRLLLSADEDRATRGQAVHYVLANGVHIQILSLNDRVVARRQWAGGDSDEMPLVPARDVFDIAFLWRPELSRISVWSDSENSDRRRELARIWAGVHLNESHTENPPMRDYDIARFGNHDTAGIVPTPNVTHAAITVLQGQTPTGGYFALAEPGVGIHGSEAFPNGAPPGIISNIGFLVGFVHPDGRHDVAHLDIGPHRLSGCDGDDDKAHVCREFLKAQGVTA